MTSLLERVGRVFLNLFEQTGLWFRMLLRTFVWAFRPPFEPGEWVRQMVRVGVDSIPVVFLTSMFTGMVLALQTFYGFQRVHAENFVGSVVALAPSELSTDAIAGRVRCCDTSSATVLLPAEACSYSSRAAALNASREPRIWAAGSSRRYRSSESVSATRPSISRCMRVALF